jgi:hypothetical protein
MIATAHETAPAKPQRKKSAASPARTRVKASLMLSADVDLRLTVLAKLKGLDKSALAERIIGDATRGVVVSLRGMAADPHATLTVGEDRLGATGE